MTCLLVLFWFWYECQVKIRVVTCRFKFSNTVLWKVFPPKLIRLTTCVSGGIFSSV